MRPAAAGAEGAVGDGLGEEDERREREEVEEGEAEVGGGEKRLSKKKRKKEKKGIGRRLKKSRTRLFLDFSLACLGL